jgi:HD-like signal output (HDOD) protein
METNGETIMSTCYICGEELLKNIKAYRPVQVVGCSQCLNVSLVNWTGEDATMSPVPGFESLGNKAPRGSIIAGILEHIPQAITDLPVLAEIPQRVVSTIHDPISDISDVVAIIEEDVVFSTKILSLANSAYFATPSEISDLNTACSRLGMKALANIANALASAGQYKSSDPLARKLLQGLWQHAIVTAHCTDALATRLTIQNSNTFIAGLLHDIGKVVLVDTIFTRYVGPTGRLKESPEVLARAIEPFAPLVGLHVAQHWKLALS